MLLCLHPVGSFWCAYIHEYQQFVPPTLAGIPLAFGAWFIVRYYGRRGR